MSAKSSKLDFDLNSSFALINISDFLADLSMINDASKKLTKLNDYIDELEVELKKIDGLNCELPLCILLMNEGIERLKEERMRTEAEARPLTREILPLKGGDNFNEDAGVKKSSNCTDWMSSARLWTTNVQSENPDTKKQDFVSNLKSDVKQQNVSASPNSYDQMGRKLKISEVFCGPIQRQSSLIIKEKNNFLPVIALPASVSRGKLGPVDMNLKRNINKTSTGLPAFVSRVELGPVDMDLKQNMSKTSTSLPPSVPMTPESSPIDMNCKPNMSKPSTGLPTFVSGVGWGSIDMNLKRNISKTSTGSSLTTNPGKKPRLCRSPELHKAFIDRAQQLGGPNVSTSKQITENMQSSEGHIEAFQRQSGVIIKEKKNLLAVDGPSSSVPRAEKGNIPRTSSDSSLTADPERKPRRCWSNELHAVFVNALQHLGGPYVATPKQIRERMRVDDLTSNEVKSHLQKYRLHIRKSPERLTASSSYIWPGRGCRHANMSKGSTSQAVSINGSAKQVSTSTGAAHNAPENTTGGDDNEAKNKDDKKSEDHN